ncbi:hypothetical protein PHET_07990 [Paragonimus heterotremus]|uniref:Uncharacterized protein n=1 Tax=Paragonimus heterotremus TaxID=100268 RepID=A0A8J4TFN4_9TREM|nr:hypothetical protein PHET_07990 [Paragonimus heterotremus]
MFCFIPVVSLIMKDISLMQIPESSQFRMAKKPPRPRQSQSPALRMRISTARPEVPVRDTPYETDQIPSDSLVQPEFIESSKVNKMEGFDDYQDLFYTTNLMIDGEEGLHVLHFSPRWIKETSKAESMSTHPFLIPTSLHLQSDTAWRTHKPSLTSFDPSLDILAQWRLRRKMEAAQWAVCSTNQPSSDFYPGYSQPPFYRASLIDGYFFSFSYV